MTIVVLGASAAVARRSNDGCEGTRTRQDPAFRITREGTSRSRARGARSAGRRDPAHSTARAGRLGPTKRPKTRRRVRYVRANRRADRKGYGGTGARATHLRVVGEPVDGDPTPRLERGGEGDRARGGESARALHRGRDHVIHRARSARREPESADRVGVGTSAGRRAAADRLGQVRAQRRGEGRRAPGGARASETTRRDRASRARGSIRAPCERDGRSDGQAGSIRRDGRAASTSLFFVRGRRALA